MISNIVLTGMPGTFKTSAGRLLAERLDMHFLDTDAFFEFEYGMKISECFDKYGEEAFRDLESKVADRVYYFENTVIATGGGIVERDSSMEKLKRFGIIVLLTCETGELYRRVRKDKDRPKLRGWGKKAKLKKIWAARREKYRKYADITIDNTRLDSAQTADAIERAILDFYKK